MLLCVKWIYSFIIWARLTEQEWAKRHRFNVFLSIYSHLLNTFHRNRILFVLLTFNVLAFLRLHEPGLQFSHVKKKQTNIWRPYDLSILIKWECHNMHCQRNGCALLPEWKWTTLSEKHDYDTLNERKRKKYRIKRIFEATCHSHFTADFLDIFF